MKFFIIPILITLSFQIHEPCVDISKTTVDRLYFSIKDLLEKNTKNYKKKSNFYVTLENGLSDMNMSNYPIILIQTAINEFNDLSLFTHKEIDQKILEQELFECQFDENLCMLPKLTQQSIAFAKK